MKTNTVKSISKNSKTSKKSKTSATTKRTFLEDALTIDPHVKRGLFSPKYERDLLRKFHSTQEEYFLRQPSHKGGKRKTQKKYTRKNNKSRKNRK